MAWYNAALESINMSVISWDSSVEVQILKNYHEKSAINGFSSDGPLFSLTFRVVL